MTKIAFQMNTDTYSVNGAEIVPLPFGREKLDLLLEIPGGSKS